MTFADIKVGLEENSDFGNGLNVFDGRTGMYISKEICLKALEISGQRKRFIDFSELEQLGIMMLYIMAGKS